MLKKKEMQESITILLNEVTDQKSFCKKYGISEVDFYPFAFGYMVAELALHGQVLPKLERAGHVLR